MQEASIEYTFYQTELFNNKFLVIEEVAGEPVLNRLIAVEIGNYNLITFIIELTAKMNDSSYYTYLITYEANTNRLKYIEIPKPPFTQLSVVFNFNADNVLELTGDDIGESTNELMGFEVDSIITLTPVNNNLETKSTIPITMSGGVENLYVTVANSCSNYGNANVRNVFSSSNILAKVPVGVPPFSTIFFYDLNSNFSTIISNKYLDNLNLTLFNERFTKIEPRKDWTFTIKIEIIRPRIEIENTKHMKDLLDITKLKFMKKNKDKDK